jgi:D-alanyl-lipoteichoic acid acyltransferase DltB (MBOAT superfamily)
MQFNSLSYLAFLAFVVCMFWVLPKGYRRGFILGVSLLFYATWNVNFVLIPLGLATAVYWISCAMLAYPAHSKRWSWIGIAVVLGVLAFFKYRGFFLANWTLLFPASVGSHVLGRIVLPLGISFYSFEAISYLIDVRQGRIKQPKFTDLLLFIMFWPHLMAGPIVRVRELVPQLRFDKAFTPEFVFRGLDRLIWGLVQKNLFANNLGSWVDAGFSSTTLPTTADAWFLAAAFGLQIYFDFAGYSNMAIGAAQMIGVTLPENFRFPYHASTPPDFWSRWHMTLSRWIRDYLFFPIGARFKDSPGWLYLSLLTIMALVGLWHGAGWGFIVWGLLQGCMLVSYRIFEDFKTRHQGIPELPARIGWRLLTLVGVTAAWVPFRAGNFQQLGSLWHSMFLRFIPGLSFSRTVYIVTACVAFFCAIEPIIVDALSRFFSSVGNVRGRVRAGALLVRPFIYICGLLLFMIFDQQDAQFIYFQF